MYEKSNSYDYDGLISSGHGEIFGPRNARLPLPPMLMFDRISNISDKEGKFGNGVVTAELDVKPDLWFFECHFESDPVMLGCLGLDALWQMLGFFLGWNGGQGTGRALGVSELKLKGQIMPDAKKVDYRIDIKRVIRSKLILGIADGQVSVDGDLIYTATNLKVGLFEKQKIQNM